VRAVLRFGVEGGGKVGSSSVVVVAVGVLRFLEFLGGATTAAGASILGTRLLAALRRLERRVAIAAREDWRIVMRATRCIILKMSVRRWIHVIA
jgi:hypothetical protein